jgi:hypothetical protein
VNTTNTTNHVAEVASLLYWLLLKSAGLPIFCKNVFCLQGRALLGTKDARKRRLISVGSRFLRHFRAKMWLTLILRGPGAFSYFKWHDCCAEEAPLSKQEEKATHQRRWSKEGQESEEAF